MPLTVFAKSSGLEVYLTEPARSMSDRESSFYKQIKKYCLYHAYISFEKRADESFILLYAIFPYSDWDMLQWNRRYYYYVYIQAKTDKAVK